MSTFDTSWFDLYHHHSKQEYIEKYWQGVGLDPKSPKWEYLVDGIVEVNDPEGLQKIRKEGGHLRLS
ncbi:MAG: hypothetical protein ACYTXT_11020 [Nostoc sp.]|uniref:hypothetical protein n=1 Tax=Nostoc sp. TaxID=1180 RepID=UPI002FF26A22